MITEEDGDKTVDQSVEEEKMAYLPLLMVSRRNQHGTDCVPVKVAEHEEAPYAACKQVLKVGVMEIVVSPDGLLHERYRVKPSDACHRVIKESEYAVIVLFEFYDAQEALPVCLPDLTECFNHDGEPADQHPDQSSRVNDDDTRGGCEDNPQEPIADASLPVDRPEQKRGEQYQQPEAENSHTGKCQKDAE